MITGKCFPCRSHRWWCHVPPEAMEGVLLPPSAPGCSRCPWQVAFWLQALLIFTQFSSSISHRDTSHWIWGGYSDPGQPPLNILITLSKNPLLKRGPQRQCPRNWLLVWIGWGFLIFLNIHLDDGWFLLTSELLYLVCLVASRSLWLSDFRLYNHSGPQAGLSSHWTGPLTLKSPRLW